LTTPFVETAEFLDIEELISNQGDIAVTIEEHPDTPGQLAFNTGTVKPVVLPKRVPIMGTGTV
jgi:hypothetical protein